MQKSIENPSVFRDLWKSMLGLGLVTLTLGVVVLVWPGKSVVVAGALFGNWLGIMGYIEAGWFWFGNQGLSYIQLGRFWQIAFFIGLITWSVLVFRALWPTSVMLWRATRQFWSGRIRLENLIWAATINIAVLYVFGMIPLTGIGKSFTITDFWRWWVVHLWVEGFFEVFATVVIAFLLTRLKLLSVPTATRAVLFSTVVFLSGGIIGTFHHLYFAGTPNIVLGLGAVFSALEVVPLVLIGFEAWENIRLARSREQHVWVAAYKWPIYFFVAVAFWNFVGAGLFGFLINPPIALYYMQGLNTTPVHGHTALFGVYGMLGLGLMLFCLRALRPGKAWKNAPLSFAFWAINIGLALMVLLSMLPIGLMQTWASVEYGTWYARSAEFLHSGHMNNLRWMRMIGDTIFALGAIVLGWFVLGLVTGHSYAEQGYVPEGGWEVRPEAPVLGR